MAARGPARVPRAHITEGGVRAFPKALLKLAAGENIGQLLLAVQ